MVTTDTFRARRMIESFRLGTVPYDCVQDFIFGRDAELDELRRWLDQDDQNTLLTIGEYGAGKTHFLHYAYAHALQSGYAVALVEMDVNESPFHRPKHVYHQLARSLRFRADEGGGESLMTFRDLLREALNHYDFRDHLYLQRLHGRVMDETLWDWIEARDWGVRPINVHESARFGTVSASAGVAERRLQRMEESLREIQRMFDGTSRHSSIGYTQLPGLYPYYKAANIYCYLLSGFGWAVRHVLGLNGLLLIFDEAENVDQYDNLYQADKSRNFLSALLRTASDDPSLLDRPAESGLDFCRVGIGPRVPFLYKPESGLKLLFGWTPMDLLESFPELQDSWRIHLSPLGASAQRDLLLRLQLLYRDAYGQTSGSLSADATESILAKVLERVDATRFFVKGCVEALDLLRLCPQQDEGLSVPIDEVLG